MPLSLCFIFIPSFNILPSSLSPSFFCPVCKFFNITCHDFEQRDPLVANFSNKICNCLCKMKRHHFPVTLEKGRVGIPFRVLADRNEVHSSGL